MTRQETLNVPKAAQQFAADAAAAGFTVTVTRTNSEVSVWVERGEDNASATWTITTVYDGLVRDERLGFRTHSGRDAVRFESGVTRVRGEYIYHRSLRQIRGIIGLTVR